MNAILLEPLEPLMMNAAAEDRAAILHKVCRQADAGEYPTSKVLGMLSGWREIFEEHPLLDSPSYHALRTVFRWPELGDRPEHPTMMHFELVDALEGKPPDPWLDKI